MNAYCNNNLHVDVLLILGTHTCDRVAMLQLEICKFLAGDLVS